MMRFKQAFTLAEVLITLGIIGVVAAMTIPTLITEYQKKQTVTKLQRAISVINQAYRLSYDENGQPTPTEGKNMGGRKYFDTYWAPYIKVLTYCTTYKQCGYDHNAYLAVGSSNTYPNQTSVVNAEGDSRATFYTMDGYIYAISVWTTNANNDIVAQTILRVDINNSAKPNRYGRDVFWLDRVSDEGGGVQPYGYDKSDTYVEQYCQPGGIGQTCAEKIKRAGWKIDKSYPW